MQRMNKYEDVKNERGGKQDGKKTEKIRKKEKAEDGKDEKEKGKKRMVRLKGRNRT